MGKQRIIHFVLWLGVAGFSAHCPAQQHITLLYNERPPYQISHPDGSVSGLTATPVVDALRSAGIAFSWEKIPTNRQLAMIQENLAPVCGIGWFKNPERLTFAKFTKPIYRDKPTLVIANAGFVAPEGERLADLLAISQVQLLVKDKYSYGPYIDELFLRLKPVLVPTTAENLGMIKMIKAGRADIMLASEEEADYFVTQAGYTLAEFKLMKFSDLPAGERRYLMCSNNVADGLIERLNKAITLNESGP